MLLQSCQDAFSIGYTKDLWHGLKNFAVHWPALGVLAYSGEHNYIYWCWYIN